MDYIINTDGKRKHHPGAPFEREYRIIEFDEWSDTYEIPEFTIWDPWVTVHLKRTYCNNILTDKGDAWLSSICLPFDVDRDQLKREFGDDVIIAEFASVAKTHYTKVPVGFNFKEVPSIEAGKPYLIKPSKENDKDYYEFFKVKNFIENPIDIEIDGFIMKGLFTKKVYSIMDFESPWIIDDGLMTHFLSWIDRSQLEAFSCYIMTNNKFYKALEIWYNIEKDPSLHQ